MNSEKHVKDIQKILDKGASWREVGAEIGMSAELAVIHYAHHAAKELDRLRLRTITEESAILARELAYGVPKKHWDRYATLRKELDEYLFAIIDAAEPPKPEPEPTAAVQPKGDSREGAGIADIA